jgi:hypothetical protein
MDKFVNWGNETPEQKLARLKYEEEMREFAINKHIMEARQAANQAAQAAAAASGGGGGGETTTTTTAAPTTTTTTAAATTTTTTHVAGVDFTIEWWMKVTSWTTPTGHPRPYSLGAFPAPNAVSIENSGGHVYWWTGGGYKVDKASLGLATNTWHHMAVTRSNGSLSLYINGTREATGTWNAAIPSNSNVLYIGAEPGPDSQVKGKMTNFRWTANAIYSGASFTVPTSPLTALADTKFLMLATDSGHLTTDSSTYARTITNVNSATWSSDSPFTSGGGSVNFDGTGYFTVPASTDWDL